MCGIGGVFGYGSVAQTTATLGVINRALSHRGPDDEGLFVRNVEPFGGLSARRLAIQDPSPSGHQPMVSHDGRSVGVMNGELYNVSELRAELNGLGHSFRGSSDTEVLLAAHEAWGTAFLERLRGMFAFAILNHHDGTVVLARDRLGIKPLYYVGDEGHLLFASELKAILATGLVTAEISELGLESFLSYGSVSEPGTLIAGVELVPAGHVLIWRRGDRELRPYWTLSDAFTRESVDPGWEQSRIGTRAVLEDAVAKHLISDVPLGVFLSGGVDSTSLVGLVAEVSGTPPLTVSVDFAERSYSERPYMDLVARRFGTDHHRIRLSSTDLLALLPRSLSAMDQPTIDGMNTYVVSAAARRAGLTVALSGLGADELFGGYETFRHLETRGLIDRLPRPVRIAGSTVSAALMPRGDRRSKVAQWLRSDRTSSTLLYRQLFDQDTRRRLAPSLTPATTTAVADPRDPFNAVSLAELRGYMRNTLLRDADVFSMAHGLEVRLPFLDHAVVEYVGGLPGRLKASRGPKGVLIAATRDLLPAEIVRRQKMGFTLPYAEWMRSELKQRVEDTLLDPSVGGPVQALLDDRAIRNVWSAFQSGLTSWARPWSLFVVKTWGQRLAALKTEQSNEGGPPS